jgi:ribonuclease HI
VSKSNIISRQHVGYATENTVFEAELIGIILATKVATDHILDVDKITFYVDNQAAIKSTKRQNIRQSAQHLIRKTQSHLEDLRNSYPTAEIVIFWCPAHVEIAGNELADQYAKEAAQDRSLNPQRLPVLPINKAAMLQNIRTKTRINSRTEWTIPL